MQTVIKVENLSKAYQIGQIGTGTISRDLERFWSTRIRGKEDPFLRIGETNNRATKGKSDIVWSLKDINFEVNQGEAVGIIGKNGAGKSTLLKLLSRVTGPTTGEIKVKGRIASLLEVGTGFHPELSGRENIYLNGAILGMRKKEITRKLDEIIDFSGVERYIDTPVKRYSSGMYVRLAFAVAAHLESEILIVDEVLAVGDAEFQKKCLGKMGDISKGQGRTVLFVSHNMAAVKNLCSKGIFLENGLVNYSGDVDSAVDQYLNSEALSYATAFENASTNKPTYIKSFKILSEIATGAEFRFEAVIDSDSARNVELAIGIRMSDSSPIMHLYSGHVGDIISLSNGTNVISGTLASLPLASGSYTISLWMGAGGIQYDFHPNAITIMVREGAIRLGGPVSTRNGYPVITDTKWTKI